ncbi:MAG: DUF4332 domain-containing protein, partial [Candidatus Thermoplasmatota archaeon]|nr:DUF4332 domain-containing protein [Candidatus Thermoplasmatota archaeon]
FARLAILLVVAFTLLATAGLATAPLPGLLTVQQAFFLQGLAITTLAGGFFALLALLTKQAPSRQHGGGDEGIQAQLMATYRPRRLSEVPDLEDAYVRALQNIGLTGVHELAKADLTEIAPVLGVPTQRLARWQAAATFLTLPDVTPGDAALLVDAGFASLQDLGQVHPSEALLRVEGAQAAGHPDVLRPSARRVEGWVAEAQARLEAQALDRLPSFTHVPAVNRTHQPDPAGMTS